MICIWTIGYIQVMSIMLQDGDLLGGAWCGCFFLALVLVVLIETSLVSLDGFSFVGFGMWNGLVLFEVDHVWSGIWRRN